MSIGPKSSATIFTTPSDREIMATRVFDAPRERVFDAWTDPRHIPHWMIGSSKWTMPVCEVDLRPGGEWHFTWRRVDDGSEMAMWGVYREIKAPEQVISTELWGGDWPETVNTLQLSELEGKTMMTLTIWYPSKEARDAVLGTGMKEGMDHSYDRLAVYLASENN